MHGLRPMMCVALLVGLAMSASGCQLVGWAADVVAAGKPIKPVYDLANRPTLVMIDDPTDKLTTVDLPNLMAGRIGDTLVQKKVVAANRMLPANRPNQLAADHADFKQWPVDRVGREAGAEQVIYVVVQAFSVSDHMGVYRPVAQVNVRVIDVASGRRLFPAGTDTGHPVIVEQFYQSMDGSTGATDTIIARRLAEELAATIARLFHSYLPEEAGTGSRLPG